MSDTSEFEESPVKKRKGSGSIVEKMKQARRKGEEFVTTNGRLVVQKKTGPDCECRKMCTVAFSNVQKENIIKSVYSGRPKNEQDTYLIGLIERLDVARHRPKSPHSKEFSSSFKYFAIKDSERVEVCRNAFISLHAVSNKVVYRLTQILAKGEQPIDMRGKHYNHNKMSNDVLVKVKEHIDSYPKKTSHYSSTVVTYLDAGLTCTKMHEMLVEKHPELKDIIKYEYFLTYYKENYGYRFGRPQVDVCSMCEDLNTKIKSSTLNENAKRVSVAELMVHKRRASKFYKKIQEVSELCSTRDDVHGICFDFMQNLPLPCMPVQEMFYLRKLWHYVFCVHSLGDNKSTMFTYHEGVANKGANEVCTLLYHYINNSVDPQVKTLYVFSDACPGQNRNHTLVRLFLSLTITRRFNEVHVFFPIRGHSFLPCDRNFGVIKRVIKRHDRIYTPDQYNTMISTAKTKQPAFVVQSVSTEQILNFKDWWPTFSKKNCVSVQTKQPFKISTYRQLTFTAAKRGYVTAHTFIDGAQCEVFKLYKGGDADPPVEKAYNGRVPIKKKKLEDVAKVIHYVPENYRVFYTDILQWPSGNENEDSD